MPNVKFYSGQIYSSYPERAKEYTSVGLYYSCNIPVIEGCQEVQTIPIGVLQVYPLLVHPRARVKCTQAVWTVQCKLQLFWLQWTCRVHSATLQVVYTASTVHFTVFSLSVDHRNLLSKTSSFLIFVNLMYYKMFLHIVCGTLEICKPVGCETPSKMNKRDVPVNKYN